MGWITQLGLRINKKNATSTRTKHQLLVVMINIGAYGLLTEIDEEQKVTFGKGRGKLGPEKFEQAKDGTNLHKNFISVSSLPKYVTKRGDIKKGLVNQEYISMTEL